MFRVSLGTSWGYVSNPAGGFWNLLLNFFYSGSISLYMQIEQSDLCFKVGEVYDSRRDVRNRFHNLLMTASQSHMGLERLKRSGNGDYMTIAIAPREIWFGADDAFIDLDAILSRLDSYEIWLKIVIENAQKSSKIST